MHAVTQPHQVCCHQLHCTLLRELRSGICVHFVEVDTERQLREICTLVKKESRVLVLKLVVLVVLICTPRNTFAHSYLELTKDLLCPCDSAVSRVLLDCSVPSGTCASCCVVHCCEGSSTIHGLTPSRKHKTVNNRRQGAV